MCSLHTKYSKGISDISEDTIAHFELLTTSTNNPMVILRAKGSTRQPSRNIILWVGSYATVRKRTVLPLQEVKRETMMMLQQKKVKLANDDANTRRNPISTSGIYLTAAKVDQCRQVAENRRSVDEEKKITAKKTATKKIRLQPKRSEAFNMCINSMNSLSSSTTDEDRLIQRVQKPSNIIKDAFVHIGDKLAELPNQIRDTVAREII